MTILQDFLKDLAELVNIDAGTRNAAGVTKAAEIMKRHYESDSMQSLLICRRTAGRLSSRPTAPEPITMTSC